MMYDVDAEADANAEARGSEKDVKAGSMQTLLLLPTRKLSEVVQKKGPPDTSSGQSSY